MHLYGAHTASLAATRICRVMHADSRPSTAEYHPRKRPPAVNGIDAAALQSWNSCAAAERPVQRVALGDRGGAVG